MVFQQSYNLKLLQISNHYLGIPFPSPKGAQFECIIFQPFSVETQTDDALVL
jgi:hypothetical protein